MTRQDHLFGFTAESITSAAQQMRDYHKKRREEWEDRRDKALEIVKNTISAKIVETQVTGGTQASAVVNFGDPAAWKEYQLAVGKVQTHRDEERSYRSDARVYGTQGSTYYQLTRQDVEHYGL